MGTSDFVAAVQRLGHWIGLYEAWVHHNRDYDHGRGDDGGGDDGSGNRNDHLARGFSRDRNDRA